MFAFYCMQAIDRFSKAHNFKYGDAIILGNRCAAFCRLDTYFYLCYNFTVPPVDFINAMA